jgi:hypothetical protein
MIWRCADHVIQRVGELRRVILPGEIADGVLEFGGVQAQSLGPLLRVGGVDGPQEFEVGDF